MKDRPERLTEEAIEVNERRKNITKLSNLALQMYSWYVKYGHARNEIEEKKVKKYFIQNLPSNARILTGFYEQLYLYQSSCWYAFICQNFLKYYRYAQKWIDLFNQHPAMISVESGHYIKGMDNILNTNFNLFNYKIATLSFGSCDYETCIDYLQRIINDNVDLRYDIQCYARLLHLLAHYEIGNFEIMDSLIKSVYRYMRKMETITVIEEEIFNFLSSSFKLTRRELKPELEILLNTIKQFEKSRFETRSLAYLDIISWLESKVYEKPMSEIIHEKYISSKRKLP